MDKKTKSVLYLMISITVVLAALMVLFFVMHQKYQAGWMLSAAITMMTIFYHFVMRLLVGEIVTVIFREKEFPQDRLGFKTHSFETRLYQKLKVKNWKGNVITAKPEQFDLSRVTPEELVHNIMQAELVHRIIMVLSFVPMLFIIPFGAPWVFIITSILACMVDSIFVIIQRYNRPKAIRYMQLMQKRKARRG